MYEKLRLFIRENTIRDTIYGPIVFRGDTQRNVGRLAAGSQFFPVYDPVDGTIVSSTAECTAPFAAARYPKSIYFVWYNLENVGSDRKTVECVILLGCRFAIKLRYVILLGFRCAINLVCVIIDWVRLSCYCSAGV